ncbi:MAG: ComF family protein [Bacteroidetes bacterium]|nr:ComF family protein [Bacteroidota bacterium]
MRTNLSRYWYDFVDLLFPRCCEACERALTGSEAIICTDCRVTLPRMESDSALRATLASKFVGYREIKGVSAYLAFTKKGKVQNLLHALKYKKQQEVGVLLGKMMAQEAMAFGTFPKVDFIVSIPLHKDRLKERGYNQSDAFARGLSEVTGVAWSGEALRRIRYTQSQTGKSKIERRKNVQGIFEVAQKEQIAGKSILLVDDVLTTGATLEACTEALIQAGCSTVYIMTIAAAQ